MSYEVVDLVNDAFPITRSNVYVSEVIDLVSPQPKKRRGHKESVVDLTDCLESAEVKVVIQKEVHVERVAAGVKCPICLEITDDHTVGDCGHTMCKACITKIMKTTKTCPACRKRLYQKSLRRVFWNY